MLFYIINIIPKDFNLKVLCCFKDSVKHFIYCIKGIFLDFFLLVISNFRTLRDYFSDNAKDKIAANGLPDTYAIQSMPEYVSCSGVSSTSPTSNPYACARTSIYQNIMDQLPTHGNLTAGYKLWQTLVQLQQDKGFYPEVTARNTAQTEPGMLAFSGFIPQRADGSVFNLLQDELYMPSGIPDSIGPIPSAALPHDVQYGLRVESTNDEAQLVILSAMNDGSVDEPRDYWRAHNLPFTVTSMLDVDYMHLLAF